MEETLLFAGGAIAMMPPPSVAFAVVQPSFVQGLTVGACIERLVRA